MLILTRRIGESLIIGNNVTMTVLSVKGNQVRIGVNAPKDVSVHREEIYERIKKEHAKDGSDVEDVMHYKSVGYKHSNNVGVENSTEEDLEDE